MTSDRLLLVTHVPIKRAGGVFSIDDQTSQGLVRWSESFETVAYAGIEVLEPDHAQHSSTNWVPIPDLPCADRLEIFTMPNAYRVQNFVGAYKAGRARLANEIARSRFLCFTLGALAGDWAAVAGLESIRQKRKYAVWFDRVEHEVVRSDLPGMPLKRRIKETMCLPIMQGYHRYLVRRSSIGLFQGKDCYNHYSRFTDAGHCVYDTHTKDADFIDANHLDEKITAVLSGAPLKICYVGRAADMKGPFDWIDVLGRLRDAGVSFTARWLGDGPLLEKMRIAAAERNLDDRIEFPGFSSSREDTLRAMKDAHLFVFCHKTPESPRCLIESLVCGTPILGYGSAYARDLVSIDGGGDFVTIGDASGLADRLLALHRDRRALANLVTSAAQSGLRFDEEKVYRHRADLIRETG